jgi:hypothetical protein
MERVARDAWTKAQSVVQCVEAGGHPSRRTRLGSQDVTRSLEKAAWLFRGLEEQCCARLQIRVRGSGKRRTLTLIPDVSPASDRDPYTAATVLLWKFFFHADGYRRLKVCRQCVSWFVDQGKNKKAIFCSRACADAWWTRPRRKLGRQALEIEVNRSDSILGPDVSTVGQIMPGGPVGKKPRAGAD